MRRAGIRPATAAVTLASWPHATAARWPVATRKKIAIFWCWRRSPFMACAMPFLNCLSRSSVWAASSIAETLSPTRPKPAGTTRYGAPRTPWLGPESPSHDRAGALGAHVRHGTRRLLRVAAEARWQPPRLGTGPPPQFIERPNGEIHLKTEGQFTMTKFEMWGPRTGAALNPSKRRTYLKHRNWFWRVFWTLAALSALTGAYLA